LAEPTSDKKLKLVESHGLETVWVVHDSTIGNERSTSPFGNTSDDKCLDPEIGDLISKGNLSTILPLPSSLSRALIR
jgi:hypothetical protein